MCRGVRNASCQFPVLLDNLNGLITFPVIALVVLSAVQLYPKLHRFTIKENSQPSIFKKSLFLALGQILKPDIKTQYPLNLSRFISDRPRERNTKSTRML